MAIFGMKSLVCDALNRIIELLSLFMWKFLIIQVSNKSARKTDILLANVCTFSFCMNAFNCQKLSLDRNLLLIGNFYTRIRSLK